jgi:hypothetical protein
MKITINNELHGTSTYTNVDPDTMRITTQRRHQIRERLCGMVDCSCGGDIREHGSEDTPSIHDEDGDLLEFIVEPGGGRFNYV